MDWEHLIDQPAPYVNEKPLYSHGLKLIDSKMDDVLKQIEITPTNAPNFQQLVSMLVINFDEFDDTPVDRRSFI